MKILVLNSGSSSIKFQLFDNNVSIASGLVEQIGEEKGRAKLKCTDNEFELTQAIPNHEVGLEVMNTLFNQSGMLNSLEELDGIGHRVVHGGESFSKPVIVTQAVLDELKAISPLAPLHNPAHIVGIETAIKQSKGVPQVVVFDTAYHRTLPEYAYMYALPYELYEELHVRRYGFHGTSHHYVAKTAAAYLNIPMNAFNAISLHLGNGASVTAIKNGQSVDTSMGLSPLEGLIMGTRSGDVDPAALFYIAREKGLGVDDLDTLVNKKSGLKGICGTNDMREIEEMIAAGNEKAKLAFEMFAYRIKKYIGAYSAALGRVDALIFTGGIGENDAALRKLVCTGLENLGISIDFETNNQRCKIITALDTDKATVKTLVVPTNEELEIALQTKEVIEAL